METHVAAWQLDMFGESSPVLITHPKPDPFPDPHLWSEATRNSFAEALYWFALDSRHNDNLPEALRDCAHMLSDRLANRKLDVTDYWATLGWIMGYWKGAVPYEHVCTRGRLHVPPDILRNVIFDNALLTRDLHELQDMCFGRLMQEGDDAERRNPL